MTTTNKTILSILLAIVIVGGGYYYWYQHSPVAKLKLPSNAQMQAIESESNVPTKPGEHQGDATFTRDSNHVYVDGTVIADADPATFEVLTAGMGPIGMFFAVDKSYAFYGSSNGHTNPATSTARIIGADPATFFPFTSIAGWNFAKDSKHVYFGDEILKTADPATFGIVGPVEKDGQIEYTIEDKTTVFAVISDQGNLISGNIYDYVDNE